MRFLGAQQSVTHCIQKTGYDANTPLDGRVIHTMVISTMTKTTTIPLIKTEQQIQEGYGDLTARMNSGLARDLGALDYEWKLVKRWGTKPVFAAESKVKRLNGKRTKIQLHRFAWGLHETAKDSPKIYVIPKDGDALNCELDNLLKLTQEDWDSRKHRSAGSLTEEQQAWLDAECDRTGLGKWEVVGALIQRELEQNDPFA